MSSATTAAHLTDAVSGYRDRDDADRALRPAEAVSYTHLTLPTKA